MRHHKVIYKKTCEEIIFGLQTKSIPIKLAELLETVFCLRFMVKKILLFKYDLGIVF